MSKTPNPTLADVATYVEETCAELRRLATDPRLRTVSYLLDMARVEAKAIAQAERAAQRSPSGSH